MGYSGHMVTVNEVNSNIVCYKGGLFLMKKSRLLIVLAGLAVFASGCGYSTGGEDSTVTVIEATPTPEVPEATPTPAQEVAQTASGVNIIKQNATYYVVEGVNVRSDCSTEAEMITGTTVGQELTSTGVSEDGQWIEVTVNGQTGYVNAQYVSTTAPAGAAAQTTAQ